MKKFLVMFTVFLAMVVVVVSAASEREAAAAPEKEIVLAVTNEPTSYMPGFVIWNDVNSVGSRNIFEALVTRHPVTNELAGELATHWERIDDTTWRFHLRRGVTFHDGSPFNAEVAVRSINDSFNKDIEPNKVDRMGPQITAEAIDQYTIYLKTAEPDPIVPTRLFLVTMSPVKTWENQEQYARNPIGTGPYKFVEWRSGQYVKMEANPDWWGHKDPEAALGRVTFTSAIFNFRPENTVRKAMVEAGEADFAMYISADMCSDLKARSGTDCISAPSFSTIFIRFDAILGFMTDQRVREAVLYALDMDLILKTILQGASPATQIIGPAVTGYNHDLRLRPYDPERAKQLLAEAQRDGVKLEAFELAYQEARFPEVRELVQAMQAMLQAVGLNAKVLEMERSAFHGQFNQGTYPPNRITIHTHGNSLGDADTSVKAYFYSEGAGAWVIDPVIDEMYLAASVKDGAERQAAFAEIMAYVHQKAYMGFGGHIDYAYGLSSRLDWTPPPDHRLLLKNMGLRE